MSRSFLISSLFITLCLEAALAKLSLSLPSLQPGQLASDADSVPPNNNGISPVSLADDG